MNRDASEINHWFATDEAKKRCDPVTLEAPKESKQYLRNRIWKTLQEGIAIGRRLQREEDKERLASLLD